VAAATAARREHTARLALAALVAATVAVAVALFAGVVVDLEPYDSGVRISWWMLAIGFALTELFVVHAHVRGSAHSLSLSELPLILGLLLAHPQDVVIAQVVGPAVVLILTRGHSPIKLLFNIAQFALTSTLAVVVLHGVATQAHASGPTLWAATFAAVGASSLVGAVLVFCAIGLAEGAVPSRQLAGMMGADLVVAITNTSVGLACASVVAEDVRSGWLLLPPAAILLLAYRAYLSERTKHQSLEFLYEVARSVSRAPDFESALVNLLNRCRSTFRVRVAEVVLFATGGDIPLRTSLAPDEESLMLPLEASLAAALRDCVQDERAVLVEREGTTGELRRYLETHGIDQALVAPVPGETRLTGVMILGDRIGVTTSFSRGDLRLFETLAEHAGMSFEFDRLEQAIGRMRELQTRLEQQAYADPLTDLANRALFVTRLRDSLARPEGSATVLYIDLDDFKRINDEGGHAAGDELLVKLADRLRQSVRPNDLAARLGGDEFALLLEDVDDLHAEQVAERLLESLVSVDVDGRRMAVGTSMGIASARAGAVDPDELMGRADGAMYRAKQAGKGQVRVWTPEMRASGLSSAPRAAEIRAALRAGEIVAHYQPIVSLATGEVVALEALARWQHPRHGLLGPCDFVPMAEETGLVTALDHSILQQACRAAAALPAIAPAVHVNVSGAGLATRELLEGVQDALNETGLEPGRLVVELTESVLAADQPAAEDVLGALRALGVRVALDDFGTGYSSLAALRELPVDMLKVPKPFVDGRGRGPHDRALLTMMVQLGNLFGLQVVAEGIEHPDQFALLRELGCELGQGYLLGRPVPIEALVPRPARSIGSTSRL
jgi:diguanylate cyclase (GGDEF)-like protein